MITSNIKTFLENVYLREILLYQHKLTSSILPRFFNSLDKKNTNIVLQDNICKTSLKLKYKITYISDLTANLDFFIEYDENKIILNNVHVRNYFLDKTFYHKLNYKSFIINDTKFYIKTKKSVYNFFNHFKDYMLVSKTLIKGKQLSFIKKLYKKFEFETEFKLDQLTNLFSNYNIDEVYKFFIDNNFTNVPDKSKFPKLISDHFLCHWNLEIKSDGHGHQCGSSYEIDWKNKNIKLYGWSSDD